MEADLSAFTRQIEDCRERWHHEGLEYVLKSAQILSRARVAAANRKRWIQWLREEVHMSRVTAHRHFRVAAFVGKNVTLKKHCASLSISKVYALSRLASPKALSLIRAHGDKISKMSDGEFARFMRPFQPAVNRRLRITDLVRPTFAAVNRLERMLAKWRRPRRTMSSSHHERLMTRLLAIVQEARQLGPARRVAL